MFIFSIQHCEKVEDNFQEFRKEISKSQSLNKVSKKLVESIKGFKTFYSPIDEYL